MQQNQKYGFNFKIYSLVKPGSNITHGAIYRLQYNKTDLCVIPVVRVTKQT